MCYADDLGSVSGSMHEKGEKNVAEDYMSTERIVITKYMGKGKRGEN